MTDRLLENGWIRGHAAQAVSDQRMELAGPGHSPTEIVQPDALLQFQQPPHVRHGMRLHAFTEVVMAQKPAHFVGRIWIACCGDAAGVTDKAGAKFGPADVPENGERCRTKDFILSRSVSL